MNPLQQAKQQNEEYSKSDDCERLQANIEVLIQQIDELRSESAIKTAAINSVNGTMGRLNTRNAILIAALED